MMMGRLNRDREQLFYSFRLDDVVPDDHLVRAIAAVLRFADDRQPLSVCGRDNRWHWQSRLLPVSAYSRVDPWPLQAQRIRSPSEKSWNVDAHYPLLTPETGIGDGRIDVTSISEDPLVSSAAKRPFEKRAYQFHIGPTKEGCHRGQYQQALKRRRRSVQAFRSAEILPTQQ